MKKIAAFPALALASALVIMSACSGESTKSDEAKKPEAKATETKKTDEQTTIHYPEEKHLANVRQLTFGGENA